MGEPLDPRAQPDGSKGSRTPRPPRAGYLRSVVHVAPATRDWTGRSWLAGYQRALDQIEKMLLTDDYRLPSLVAFFIRLARNDVMPGTERVQTWPGSSL